MATYGYRSSHRSSQRPRRDEPAPVVSSSRPIASTSRRDDQVGSSSAAPSSRPDTHDDEDDQDDLSLQGLVSPPKELPVTDRAQKIIEKVGQSEIDKKATELARYALACEYQRTLIRKDDIRAKVLDKDTSGAFNPVFNGAQKLLHRTFGYHMVEVRAKGADNAELTRQAQEVLRAAASSANGLRPRSQQAGDLESPEGGPSSNIWVLRSALPKRLIEKLVSADEDLTRAFAPPNRSNSSSSSPQRRRQQTMETKSALDWNSADHQDGELGLLYIVLALILVNGRTISDATLHMYLRRIHLDAQTPLPRGLRGTGPALSSTTTGSQNTQTQVRNRALQSTLEGFLTAMVKQSYLEKQRSDVGVDAMEAAVNQAQTQSRRRGRVGGGTGRAEGADDESTVWEWRWGSRAEAEVGEKRIAELISLLFTDPSATQDGAQAAEEEDEETQAIDRDRRAKRRKMLLANIASVAGSQLVE